jgi:fatty-acyl-CoA synthase
MIIRGGENIYPKEIEEFLVKMPDVLDVQVVAVSDEKYGEEVAAVVKVKDLATNKVTKQDILSYCKDKIAFYKIPKYVKFVTEYPLTVSGKVQKYLLRGEL